jgi:hypothetical protein
MQISLGHNPKGADCPQHAALGAIDLIDTVALPNQSAFASTWQVEVFREHVARVEILIPIAIARAAAATDIAVPSVLTIPLAIPGIVPIPHFRFDFSADRCSRITRERSASPSMDSSHIRRNQSLAYFGWRRVVSECDALIIEFG